MGEIIEEVQDLELQSIIGFDGSVPNGLKLHCDGVHIVYPLGSKVVIQNWKNKEQTFLSGHTYTVSTVDISLDGKYVASGQMNHMGFKASVIIWNFEKRNIQSRHELHKVRVESVVFSCDNKYVISLGGRDDGTIVVWDVEASAALCGSIASIGTMGDAYLVHAASRRGLCFYSGGMHTLRVWIMNPRKRSLMAVNVTTGSIKRHILCMVTDDQDEFLYCGTTTGDIMKIRLNFGCDLQVTESDISPVLLGCYGKFVSKKKAESRDPTARYQNGVTAIMLVPNDLDNSLIVGAGDGSIEIVKEQENSLPKGSSFKIPSQPQLRMVKSANVHSPVTSLGLRKCYIYVGTQECEIYTIHFQSFEILLHVTCHTDAVFSVTFPHDYSQVFATSSKNDIRVWHTETSMELLRICVPNFTCTSIAFSRDGKSIVSGWNDGLIRVFTPETGKLIFIINNAHNRGVSAIGITSDGKNIVSGGGEGQVRVWEIRSTSQILKGILKEHKGPISSIHLTTSNTEAVSASTDGTCIIWDIVNMVRQQVLFANTQFMCAKYYPTGVQIITVGTDRKIAYWEVYDGSLLRELEASTSGAINSVSINNIGNIIATGGNDQIVKVWKYMEGVTTHIGIGHAGVITCICFSPDNRFIISVGADGGIFRWKCPYFKVEDLEDQTEVESIPETSISRSTCSLREDTWKKVSEEKVGSTRTTLSTASSKSSESSKKRNKLHNDISSLCSHIENVKIPCTCAEEKTTFSQDNQETSQCTKFSGEWNAKDHTYNMNDVICSDSDSTVKKQVMDKSSRIPQNITKTTCKCIQKLEKKLESKGKTCDCIKKLHIIACQNKGEACNCVQKLQGIQTSIGKKKCDCVQMLRDAVKYPRKSVSKLSVLNNKGLK